jgi:hypothetical protein
MRSIGPVRPVATSLSAFARFQFPPEVIILAVQWYLRFGLSYRDVEERCWPSAVTDRAPVYPKLLDELLPAAWHHSEQYGNNRIEADHGQLKRRLRPMRHLRTDRTARLIITVHAFVQNALARTTSPPACRPISVWWRNSTNSATRSEHADGRPTPPACPTINRCNIARRNLAMDLHNAGCHVKYLVRDRDGKYPYGAKLGLAAGRSCRDRRIGRGSVFLGPAG